jgi:phosphopantetheinyl transferase (holo-ACP synthase)
VSGRAAALAKDRGVSGWHLSLSHTELVAIAVVAAL